MRDADHKAGLRSLLDGSREAIEAAIADAVEDPADAEPLCEQLRELITAERALADDRLRQVEMPDEDFVALVAKHRARLGR